MNSPSLGSQRRQLFILCFLLCLERRFATNLSAIPWLKERGKRRGEERRRREEEEEEEEKAKEESKRTRMAPRAGRAKAHKSKGEKKKKEEKSKRILDFFSKFSPIIYWFNFLYFWCLDVFNQLLLFQTSPPIFSNFIYLCIYSSWPISPTSPKKWNEMKFSDFSLQHLEFSLIALLLFSFFKFCLAIYLAPPCFPIHAPPMQEEMGIGKLSIFKPYFVSPLVGFNF